MEEYGQEDTDTAVRSEDNNQAISAVYDQDKSNIFWLAGVMDCFSTVLSLFRGTDLKPAKGKYKTSLMFSGAKVDALRIQGCTRNMVR